MALTFLHKNDDASLQLIAGSQSQLIKSPEVQEPVQVETTTVDTSLGEWVNRLISVEQALEAANVKYLLSQQKSLREVLVGSIPEGFPDNQTYSFYSDTGIITFSAKEKKTEIATNDKVLDSIGQETFNAIAKFGVTDLKKYLVPSVLSKILTDVPGSRKYKSFAVKS